MTVSVQKSRRPFGNGLRDPDIRLVVASADVRYRPKLQAVIVSRPSKSDGMKGMFAVELMVLNTEENIKELESEAGSLDPDGRLIALIGKDLIDVTLVSPDTGECMMLTSVSQGDFERIQQISVLEQIHIGGKEDRGSWVCRFVDVERLDELFGNRPIDLRADAS